MREFLARTFEKFVESKKKKEGRIFSAILRNFIKTCAIFLFAKKKSRTFWARGRLQGERPTASNNTEEEEEEEEEDAVVVVIQFLSAAVVVAVCLLRRRKERENTNTSDTKSVI